MNTENIVIVGGGSAGWMTATTLLECFPEMKITLIESPDIATVGVGESTIGSINNWKYMSRIRNDDFMRETDATYKLSIAFENWWHKDDNFRFFYPFAHESKVEDDAVLTTLWEMKKVCYPNIPWTDYANTVSPVMSLVNQNKIDDTNIGLPGYSLEWTAAYHFDATKFGIWLRDTMCLPHAPRFTHIKATVEDAKIGENGIEFIRLSGGEKIEADLFIDCTGFVSLLMDKVMGIPFESLTDVLPNNYAWATKIPYENPEEQITTYTNNTAIENGWVWEIPLQHRLGSGYVFSDRFISHDNALLEFQQCLKNKGYKNVEKLEYKKIKMRVGRHKTHWVKNCLGIGLSAAFLEPLESNGLFTVHMFIQILVSTLERSGGKFVTDFDKKTFNHITETEFNNFKDFVLMHYGYSHRDDTEYWRSVTNNPNLPIDPGAILSTVNPHNLLRGAGGRYIRKGFGMNAISTLGYKLRDLISPEQILKITDDKGIPLIETLTSLESDKAMWNGIVKNSPSPYQFLKRKGLLAYETN